MKVTGVTIDAIVNYGPFKATATVIFDHELAIHDIKIIQTPDKLFCSFPGRRDDNDVYHDVVHPVCKGLRERIESAVLRKWKEAASHGA